MMFPPVRISQLSHDLEIRRAAFEQSKDGLAREVKQKLSPINLLKEHPQLWMGAAMSLLGAGGLGRIVGFLGQGRNGHAAGGRARKSGLIAGILKFGGRTAMKTVAPVALNAVRFAIKGAFRAFRNRRHRPDSD